MGLFDSLIKNVVKEVAPDLDVDKFMKQAGDFVSQAAAGAKNSQQTLSYSQQTSSYEPAAPFTGFDIEEEMGPSGDSWGPTMPNEPNQFNFAGSYLDYFTGIFQTEFPEYRVSRAVGTSAKPVTVFTFWNGNTKALVVELMPQSSAAKKLRRECAQLGIPYLRYYYDHEGWWNTRSYVIRRTKAALQG